MAQGLYRAKQFRTDTFDATQTARVFAAGAFTLTVVGSLFAAGSIATTQLVDGANFIKRTGAVAFTADQPLGGFKFTGSAAAIANDDVPNWGQVKQIAGNFDMKEAARVTPGLAAILDSNASISGVPTYNNIGGTSSRGQITATLLVSGTFTVDGVTLANGDRVFLGGEAGGGGLGGDANGLYAVTISGTALVLDRTADADADAEVTNGMIVPVGEGTANGGSLFMLTTADPITIGGAAGTVLSFVDMTANITINSNAGNISQIDAGDTALAGSTGLAADAGHQHAVNTAAPATTVKTDASTAAEGASTSLVRADAQFVIQTAAPATAIESDASTATQGAATTTLRSDAKLVASTAAPGDVGTANAQGASTSLSRADHTHRSARPTKNGQGATPNVTAGDNATTGLLAPADNFGGGMIYINVNGGDYLVGDGSKLENAYYSANGGTTAKTLANVLATDTLYWNGTISVFDLDAIDVVSQKLLSLVG